MSSKRTPRRALSTKTKAVSPTSAAAATADALIARADLGEFAGRRASALSTGTMQRLNLAIALAGQPALLLLDEPTGTLSPDQRTRLWSWMDDLMSDGEMALVFSTQFMDEATRHADRMVALGGGEEFMRLATDDA